MPGDQASASTRPHSPSPGPGPGMPKLSNASKWSLGLLAVVSLGLAVMSFMGMFDAVRTAVKPFFGRNAWMVPVGTDLGIFFFATINVWLVAHRMHLWWVRWFVLLLLGLQLGINIGAAHGDLLGEAAHSVLPLVFFGVIEVWMFVIRKRLNLIHSSGRERIPRARYFADWSGSRDLRRRMVLWGIDRYSDALRMRQQVLRAEAGLGEIFGSDWRKTAPQDLLMMLNTSEFLAEACTEVAKRLADKRRRAPDSRRTSDVPQHPRTPTPAGSNGERPLAAPGRETAPGIRTCCAIHKLADGNSKMPSMEKAELLAEGRKMWAEHAQAHGRGPGADVLQKVLTIGIANARELRDGLAKWWDESGAPSGPGSGAGSGAEGETPVGPTVGSGYPNGSVVTVGSS